MSTTSFLIIYAAILLTMLACRCVPIFVLNGRSLSAPVSRALTTIAPAAFAALVANDLFQPELWAAGFWAGAMPLVAAVIVGVVAIKTRSLAFSAVAGVAAYVALGLLPL